MERELSYFEDELRVDLIRLAAADNAKLHAPALVSKAITRLVFAMGAVAMDSPPERPRIDRTDLADAAHDLDRRTHLGHARRVSVV